MPVGPPPPPQTFTVICVTPSGTVKVCAPAVANRSSVSPVANTSAPSLMASTMYVAPPTLGSNQVVSSGSQKPLGPKHWRRSSSPLMPWWSSAGSSLMGTTAMLSVVNLVTPMRMRPLVFVRSNASTSVFAAFCIAWNGPSIVMLPLTSSTITTSA